MPLWFLGKWMDIYTKLDWQGASFHIVHVEGEPKQEWKRYFSFHNIDMPYSFLRSKMARFYLSRRKLYSQVKDVDVDVIFTLSNLWRQEFSHYCSGKMGVPYVVRLRGNHREVRKAAKVNVIRGKALNFLETRGLKKANLVIPNSRDLAKRAVEWGVEKEKITSPVYNGIDSRMFRPMNVDRSEKFTIAYAGRISMAKRALHLLKIAENLPSVHFIVAGGKQMDVDFPSNVEYLGRLPFSEMPNFYNKADLLILPSATEGFPNTVLEAYACGKPVLVAREAFPEELKVFGSKADINEFESEIKALKKVDLKAVGRQARLYVKQHFIWERLSELIIKQLRSLLKQA